MSAITKTIIAESVPSGGNTPYQAYKLEEDTERTAYHYEKDPEFFLTLTGGEWHNYSCSLWEEGLTMTQAQEKKLDKMAELMRLEPGMHILDVGCGWGGPLVYLCKEYGVTGHGITVSANQIPVAQELAEKYGVDATVEVIHWQDLPEVERYDAIFTDEVIVHFNELSGFFAKCHKALKPGGMMVNKELHFTHSTRAHWTDPLSQHINKVYGYTGNYRTLHDELKMVDDNNFELMNIFQIPIEQYQQTISVWLKNMFDNRERLKSITSDDVYKDFRLSLKARLLGFRTGLYNLHFVISSHHVR